MKTCCRVLFKAETFSVDAQSHFLLLPSTKSTSTKSTSTKSTETSTTLQCLSQGTCLRVRVSGYVSPGASIRAGIGGRDPQILGRGVVGVAGGSQGSRGVVDGS